MSNSCVHKVPQNEVVIEMLFSSLLQYLGTIGGTASGIPSIWEAEAEQSWVTSWLGLHRDLLKQKNEGGGQKNLEEEKLFWEIKE